MWRNTNQRMEMTSEKIVEMNGKDAVTAQVVNMSNLRCPVCDTPTLGAVCECIECSPVCRLNYPPGDWVVLAEVELLRT